MLRPDLPEFEGVANQEEGCGMAGKNKKLDDNDFDDEMDLEEAGELEKLFAATAPANRPPAPNHSQRKSQWRSVEEYMEARRLQDELADDYLQDDEEE